MDDELQQLQAEERRGESALLKRHEAFHQFMQECRDCRREIAAHWQFCAHCGYGWPRTAQAAATRCHRSGRMRAPGVTWHYHKSSPETGTRLPGFPAPGSLKAHRRKASRDMSILSMTQSR